MPDDKPEKPDLKSFQLKLRPDLHRQLKLLAVERETTITDLIVEAILASLKPKPPAEPEPPAPPPDSGRKGGEYASGGTPALRMADSSG